MNRCLYQEKAEIVEVERLAADIVRLTYSAPLIARTARPGQFVMARVSEHLDPLLRRPFSVHQVADGSLQLLVKEIGRGTRILGAMAKGQRVDLVGPLGCGFRSQGVERACLIGGGIGAAPLLFLASSLIDEKKCKQVVALLGARTERELVCLAELQELGVTVLTATEDGTEGVRGLVTSLMEAEELLDSPWSVFACGPRPMLREVARRATARGWPCQVSLETVMACGSGACLGCAVPRAGGEEEGYLHVCKEGPVFEAGEVAW